MNARTDNATNILTAVQNRSLRAGIAVDAINHTLPATTRAATTSNSPGGQLMKNNQPSGPKSLLGSTGGSDGTRTRGLRRDRPAL
jgi:hypothetical protein